MTTHTPRHISVRLVPYPQIHQAACYMHMGMRQRKHSNEQGNELDAPLEIRDRWSVNYARHKLTDYDRLRRNLNDKETLELKKQVLDAIADTYPELRAECERQKHEAERANNERRTDGGEHHAEGRNPA